MEFSDTPQSAPVEDVARRRGRPRSADTIERDKRVLAALQSGPRTKEQLVEELQLRPELIYLSLWRLKRDGTVERTSDASTRHAWRLTS